jgi:asparagine synthase (glutamine-hydrolysing)
MGERLRHRGPDDHGVWSAPDAGYAVGFRRLSILDLSPQGHQPMLSADGQLVLAFNGEIYNHHALRRELEAAGGAPHWRGHSDTEVMLAAFRYWGIEAAVRRFNGMFAFAVWDRETRSLHLARDRMGEKPLYYGWAGRTFLFGSELKALREDPAWQGRIDRSALALYLRYNYVPGPYAIYEGIRKLPPGALLSLPRAGLVAGQLPSPVPYWSALAAAAAGRRANATADAAELLDEADRRLRAAVLLRMEADVPLGAFLSGGIDSSLVVALMQAQSNRPVRTFSIGFREGAYDESPYAEAVAGHLRTTHTALTVRPADALDLIPELPAVYDEPFADPSQVPTTLLARLARRHVTVALSGDGGDELFCGYQRYAVASAVWRARQRMPRWARQAAGSALRALPAGLTGAALAPLGALLPARVRLFSPERAARRLATLMDDSDFPELYHRLVSHWDTPAALSGADGEPATPFSAPGDAAGFDPVSTMMYLDQVTYLPDDILVKVDRAAMAASLETRIPFLDHEVVEWAWTVPQALKVRDGHGKWLLRELLARYVPRDFVDRPKAGFSVPIDQWLRGPLREWAGDLLDADPTGAGDVLQLDAARRAFDLHLKGRENHDYRLWTVLMFQAWSRA